MLKKLMPMNKKGAGIVTNTVAGVGALLILVVIILVITSTVLTAGLLSGTENATAYDMSYNFSQGIGNVSAKIPTILLIVAVVFLFGALVLLMRQAGQMGIGGSGGSL